MFMHITTQHLDDNNIEKLIHVAQPSHELRVKLEIGVLKHKNFKRFLDSKIWKNLKGLYILDLIQKSELISVLKEAPSNLKELYTSSKVLLDENDIKELKLELKEYVRDCDNICDKISLYVPFETTPTSSNASLCSSNHLKCKIAIGTIGLIVAYAGAFMLATGTGILPLSIAMVALGALITLASTLSLITNKGSEIFDEAVDKVAKGYNDFVDIVIGCISPKQPSNTQSQHNI